MSKLLTREEFRNQVFAKDFYLCVVCSHEAVDAHHIIERKLWPDGGYYLDNGVSLCSKCHIDAEKTDLSVEYLRSLGERNKIIPPHMYDDVIYDKWGNVILESGCRMKGELFYDENTSKIMKPIESLFVDFVKYPRTYHLPWSESISSDDRVINSLDVFDGRRVVVTEKMDGENTSMYRDNIHARSIDSINHQSRDWVKNFWSQIRMDIPKGWRVCGENLYAKHSIEYTSLKSFFMGFSMWDSCNVSMSWDDTLEWFSMLGITPVPVLYDGVYSKDKLLEIKDSLNPDTSEGYVVRLADSIPYSKFRTSVAKFVRKNHVSSDNHWFYGKEIVKNKLEGK